MKIQFFLIISFFINCSSAQEDSLNIASTLNKNRLIGVSSGVTAVWAGSMIGLGHVWYSEVNKTSWHSFDDSKNWLQMDKAGHFYTAHKISQLNYGLFRWTGLNENTNIAISSGISFGYQFTLEMLDAFSEEWGFSWSDMAANLLGTGSFALQQIFWKEERIIPKFSYSPSSYAKYRPEVLGSSFAESLLKDYNGQTYWLSFSPFTFIDNDRLPKWLCLSVGYSVNAKLVGSEETYYDPMTTLNFTSSRELVFSLDIDFNKLNIKRKWLKTMLKQLNYLKVPFPAVVFRKGEAIFKPFYF